jgi:dolichol-phosphate mannosyltransferase
MTVRFGKFGAVGIAGAAVQVVLFTVLRRWLPAAAAAAIAVELTVLHNFVWHERVTWRDRDAAGVWKRLWRFHAANGLVSMVGNAAAVYGLTEIGAPALAAQAGAIALCAPVNFLVADRWVWNRPLWGTSACATGRGGRR